MSDRKECAVCGICSHLSSYLGATMCTACVTFVFRSRKRKTPYTCKNNVLLCSKTSVRDVTAYAACKKCRMDRCLQIGTVAPELLSLGFTASSEDTPILFSVIQAFHNGFRMVMPKFLSGTVYGTSESGDHFLTYSTGMNLFKEKYLLCRLVTEGTPFVSDLDPASKNGVFQNVAFIYNSVFSMFFNMTANSDLTRFYRSPNMYLDLDLPKVASYLQSSKQGQRHTTTQHLDDINYIVRTVQPLAKDVLKSDEELAALLIICLIHANGSATQHGSYMEILQLNNVWKEIDFIYRKTHRCPGSWGNLMMLASAVSTATNDLLRFMRNFNLFSNDALHRNLE